ncbi:hypothetical protein HY493_02615 [Candidatus Woesearchaeota archaeon]|nr:hypothetical protein [Candidatus Woesearchaeota archaeon]
MDTYKGNNSGRLLYAGGKLTRDGERYARWMTAYERASTIAPTQDALEIRVKPSPKPEPQSVGAN